MPIPGSRHALPIWLSALLVLSGCGSSLPAAKPARGGAQAGEAAEEAARETTASDGARLQRALERALAAPADLTSLRLAVDCQQGSAMRNMRVFGNGVGILEERSQFRLTRAQLEAMVRALLEAGFAEMKETYGEEERDAVTVETCEVDVAVAGAAKQVVQLAEGEQSPALVALAQRLLAIGAAAAERAVTAADLRDGLEKIARGELAPEAWQVNLQRHAEPGRMSARPGFLLRIAGARATVRPRLANGGYGEPLEMDLEKPALQALAGELAASGLGRWPVNLYAVDYIDLGVQVLNHEKSVQARQFTGMDPAAKPVEQAQLERVLATLGGVAQQALESGRPVPPVGEVR